MSWLNILRTSFAALIFVCASVAAEKSLTIGVVSLPPDRANPYGSIVVPGLIPNLIIFDSLFAFDETGAVVPNLALTADMTGPTTWRINLRNGVSFSNGEPFDAEAAAAAITYLAKEAGAMEVIAQSVADVTAARALDRLTLEIETKAPNVLLPRRLAGVRIPAPKLWAEKGRERYGERPAGTGLFEVESWSANKVVFRAHRTGWRQPKLDRLELLAVPDRTARIQALRTGAIDIAADVNPEDKAAIEAAGGRFIVRPTGRIQIVSLVTTKDHPVADVRVRRALNYAVDKQTIIDVLMGGTTYVATQPAVPQSFGRVDGLTPYPFDPDRAKALLAEAGHPRGFDMLLTYPAGTMAGDDAFYQQIAADLAKVGVRMRIESGTYAQHITRIRTGGWPGEAFGMDFNNMPALDALWAMRVHSCVWSAPWHCRPEWVPLQIAAETATTLDERLRLTRELAQKFHDDPSGIYLWEMPGLDGAGPNVVGLNSGLGFLDFETLDTND